MSAKGNAQAGLAQPGQSTFNGIDAAERRLNELGYKQELRRKMTLFKTLAIAFSTMTLFTGITPLYGSSLQYGGPAPLVWGWIVVSFFTAFVAIAMAEICSSFPVSVIFFWVFNSFSALQMSFVSLNSSSIPIEAYYMRL
jgi:amino acid transporter